MEQWMIRAGSLGFFMLFFSMPCRHLSAEPITEGTITEGIRAGGGAAAKPPAEKAPIEVKVESAVLQYFSREIPQSQRTPRGEIEVIEGATATLKVEKPISFRRAKLPPGEYALSVASNEGKSHSIVLEPKRKLDESQGPEEPRSTGTAPQNKRQKVQNTSASLEGAGESKARGKEEEEKRASDQKSKEGGPIQREKASRPPQALKIIVPLRLSSAQTPVNELTFDLKTSGNGSKLRVILHAGSTEARASQLRLDK